MKQIRTVTLSVLGALLTLAIVIISCNKPNGPNPSPSVPPIISSISPIVDTIGQVIMITGVNFTGATVIIGGAAATNVSVNATVIIATVPTGASIGTTVVKVTTLAGSATFNVTILGPVCGCFEIDGKSSSNEIASSSLIGHWTFDSTTNETGGADNIAPILSGGGAITYVPGQIGLAGHFANSWLTYPSNATAAGLANGTLIGSNDTLQAGFTVSLWAQMPDTITLSTLFALYSPSIPNWPLLGIDYRKYAGVFDFDAGFSLVDGLGPYVGYQVFFQNNSFKDSLTWAFFTITYDSTSKNFLYYANNVLVKTWSISDITGVGGIPVDSSLNIIAPNYPTIGTNEGMGRTPGDLSNNLAGYMADGITGNIDDIRFFNKALTANEINDLYVLGEHGQ